MGRPRLRGVRGGDDGGAMKSGISNVRVQSQIFFNSDELEMLVTLGIRNYEIANACFAGNEDTRKRWALFLQQLGYHARKCGSEALVLTKEILGRYGTDEAQESLREVPE
jgi:hypothetical protein